MSWRGAQRPGLPSQELGCLEQVIDPLLFFLAPPFFSRLAARGLCVDLASGAVRFVLTLRQGVCSPPYTATKSPFCARSVLPPSASRSASHRLRVHGEVNLQAGLGTHSPQLSLYRLGLT